MDFYWITQLGDTDFCPPVKDISVAHFLLIHCSCSHASRLVIHIVDFYPAIFLYLIISLIENSRD